MQSSTYTKFASRVPAWLMLVGALGVPLSLLWDLSWESSVGIDRVWGPPHVATYLAIALAGCGALASLVRGTREGRGVRLGKMCGPLGGWVALWGAVAFVAALLFDRWWQASYGLAAGIWHPPQWVKAIAFFAVACGAWWVRGVRFATAGAAVLAMVAVVTTAHNFPNLQHAALFYQIACAAYPLVLIALALAGRSRFTATTAALLAMLLQAGMTWLLPLFPGAPLTGPIYHPRTHLWPVPFPLLLVVPALALDALLRVFPEAARGGAGASPRTTPNWGAAAEAGLAFFFVFVVVQWSFASFLLSPAAEGWLFAGGGKEWPFFLRITAAAQTSFWPAPVGGEFDLLNVLIALALAIVSARAGLSLGAWLQRLRR